MTDDAAGWLGLCILLGAMFVAGAIGSLAKAMKERPPAVRIDVKSADQ